MRQRLVFDELDTNNERQFTLSQFRRLIRKLGITFTDEHIDGLFHRTDTKGRGAVTYIEYLDWTQQYPILLDALFSRSSHVVECARKETALRENQSEFEQMQRKERQEQHKIETLASGVANCKSNADRQERAIRDLAAEDTSKKADLHNTTIALEKLRNARTILQNEVEKIKHEGAQASQELVLAQQHTSKAEERVTGIEVQLSETKEEERKLLARLSEIRALSAQLAANVDVAADELQRVRKDEGDAMNKVEELCCTQQQQEALVQEQLHKFLDQEELQRGTVNAAADASQSLAQASLALRQLQERFNRETLQLQVQRQSHEVIVRALEESERRVREHEKDLSSHIANGKEQDRAHQLLLEDELDVRTERVQLQVREVEVQRRSVAL